MFFAMLELGFIIRRLNIILNKIPIRLKIKSTYSVLKKPNRKDRITKNIEYMGHPMYVSSLTKSILGLYQ